MRAYFNRYDQLRTDKSGTCFGVALIQLARSFFPHSAFFIPIILFSGSFFQFNDKREPSLRLFNNRIVCLLL